MSELFHCLLEVETQVEIFFVRVWRNIQLYLTSTDGRGREGVIQILTTGAQLSSTLLILHLTTSLYGGREGCLVSLHIMRPNTLRPKQAWNSCIW